MNQKLKELKGEIENSTISVGDFNFPLWIMDWNNAEVQQRVEDLSNIIN